MLEALYLYKAPVSKHFESPIEFGLIGCYNFSWGGQNDTVLFLNHNTLMIGWRKKPARSNTIWNENLVGQIIGCLCFSFSGAADQPRLELLSCLGPPPSPSPRSGARHQPQQLRPRPAPVAARAAGLRRGSSCAPLTFPRKAPRLGSRRARQGRPAGERGGASSSPSRSWMRWPCSSIGRWQLVLWDRDRAAMDCDRRTLNCPWRSQRSLYRERVGWRSNAWSRPSQRMTDFESPSFFLNHLRAGHQRAPRTEYSKD